MAKEIWITEFARVGRDIDTRPTDYPLGAPMAEQTIDAITTSKQSSAVQANTTMLIIQNKSGSDRYVTVGTNPAATAASYPLADNEKVTWMIPPGQSFKVAAYDGSS